MTRLALAFLCLALALPTRAQILPIMPWVEGPPARTREELALLSGGAGKGLPWCTPGQKLLPACSMEEAAKIYGEGALLKSVLLNGYGDRASIYTEIASDTLAVVRIALGSTVAAGKDTAESTGDQKAKIQGFFSGGGNAVLSVAYPLLRLTSSTDRRNWVTSRLDVYVLPKLGVDLPGLGKQSSEFSLDFDGGAEVQAEAWTKEGTFAFFGQVRGAWVAGNQPFDVAMGRARPFWYVQWAAGVQVSDTIRIALTGVDGPSVVKDGFGPVTLGVSLVPSRKQEPKK